MKKKYFKTGPDAPEPLRMDILRTIRFEEVDPLGIV